MRSSTTDTRTAGQRWRDRRDLVIVVAWAGGCSQRLIADALDMSRAQVGSVLRKVAGGKVAVPVRPQPGAPVPAAENRGAAN